MAANDRKRAMRNGQYWVFKTDNSSMTLNNFRLQIEWKYRHIRLKELPNVYGHKRGYI